jgi:hypothetical protein
MKHSLCTLVVACAGCAPAHGLYPVTGTVLYQGKPAAGAAVFFQRRGGDSMSEHLIMGIVQEDGSFTLSCGDLGQGAPPGDYDVLIEWKRVLHPARSRAQQPPDRLQGRFADPKRPRFHASVQAGRNHLPPFELTD